MKRTIGTTLAAGLGIFGGYKGGEKLHWWGNHAGKEKNAQENATKDDQQKHRQHHLSQPVGSDSMRLLHRLFHFCLLSPSHDQAHLYL